jgi:hypothetical protein
VTGILLGLVIIRFPPAPIASAPEQVPSSLAASTVAPPLPSSSPTPSPSSAAVNGDGGTGSGGANGAAGGSLLPSKVLNLSNWYLTIPVKDSSTGWAQEVKQPALAGYQDPRYFSAGGGAVTFTAPVDGATTSGSKYPRSELRETTGDGGGLASWSTGSGVNMMQVTESIQHLPVAKPELVFAQIHGPSDDLIEAEIDENRLYINHNGVQYGQDLADNYVLGTKFTLEIVATSSYVNVYYNGVRDMHQDLPSTGDYFKAGCYTQSNTSHGDAPSAYGQVNIYALAVSHS